VECTVFNAKFECNTRKLSSVSLIERVKQHPPRITLPKTTKLLNRLFDQQVQASKQKQQAKRSLFNIFSSHLREDMVSFEEAGDGDTYAAVGKRMFAECVTDYITQLFQNSRDFKAKAPIFANDYCNIVVSIKWYFRLFLVNIFLYVFFYTNCFLLYLQFDQIDHLFAFIKGILDRTANSINGEHDGSNHTVYPKTYLHLLQHFYNALEELAFPVPSGFMEHFTLVSLEVLPRKVFLQAVARDTLLVSDTIIKRVWDMLHLELENNEQEACEFMHLIVRTLCEKELEIKQYEKLKSCAS